MAPHLFLAGCIEVFKTELFSGRPMDALACKRCSKQHLDSGKYANQRHTIHFCAGCGYNWDVTLQVQGNPLAALGCLLKHDGLWVHKTPVYGTWGEYQVSAEAPALQIGYFAFTMLSLG